MSVRDRVQSLEAMSKESSQKEQGRRFFRPGKQSKSQAEDATSPLLPQTRSKPSLISELDADLQGIWSVRKNIHHSSNSSSNGGSVGLVNSQKIQQQANSSVGKISQSYSRHGAIPATQSSAPHIEPRFGGIGNRGSVSPLQEHNHESRSWNLRSRGFSYSDAMKRPGRSPTGQSPAVKRKSNNDGLCNGDNASSSTHHYFTRSHDQSSKKLNYAQRMASGYMRSVGIGKYTPSESGYSKQDTGSQSNSTQWKRYDDHDEFNFD